ncbi:hypothetical protein, partial [Paenibacillus odorifer]|uniref:hypothetical protein n=1 Tax=Paenibacillus odorifer TaxID=189426 RepID=UPI001C4C788B
SLPCNVRTQMILFHKFRLIPSAIGLRCSYSLKHTLLLFKIAAIRAMQSDTSNKPLKHTLLLFKIAAIRAMQSDSSNKHTKNSK